MQNGDTIFEMDTPKGHMVITFGFYFDSPRACFAIAGKSYGYVTKLAAPITKGGATVTHQVRAWGHLSAATGAKVQAAFDAAEAAWRAGPDGQAHALRLERSQMETDLDVLRDTAWEENREALDTTLRTGSGVATPDRTAAIAAAREALRAFDAAHPEVAAEARAKRAAYIPTESID